MPIAIRTTTKTFGIITLTEETIFRYTGQKAEAEITAIMDEVFAPVASPAITTTRLEIRDCGKLAGSPGTAAMPGAPPEEDADVMALAESLDARIDAALMADTLTALTDVLWEEGHGERNRRRTLYDMAREHIGYLQADPKGAECPVCGAENGYPGACNGAFCNIMDVFSSPGAVRSIYPDREPVEIEPGKWKVTTAA